jgi:hypothetical protein
MRPSGEEIDGSFSMGDRFFLFEAKWHSTPIPASSLYAFKGKVDGKFVGTIGTFFSMSDYSKDAVDALLSGKQLNLVLFGRTDLLLIEDGKITMRDAMRVKLRYASDYGQPLFLLENYLEEQARLVPEEPFAKDKQDWAILVESLEDVEAIEILFQRLIVGIKLAFFPAGGQLAVTALASHLKESGYKNLAAIVTPIADSALQQEHVGELISNSVEVVMLRHSLEDWLGNYVPVDYYNSTMMLSSYGGKMARRYARNADLELLLKNSPSFLQLIKRIEA